MLPPPVTLMNTQTSFESSLPFFDTSAKKIKLPQPISSPRAHQNSGQLTPERPFRTRTARRTPSHLRTPSWSTSSSSGSDIDSPRPITTFPKHYAQRLTPAKSRSPSPMEQLPVQHTTCATDPSLRSPPLTPPTIQASLPPTAPMGNYSLRLEPMSPGETPQAVVVFPDATTPKRALLLLGPAIAKHVREGGSSARMHPYRVVLRPSA